LTVLLYIVDWLPPDYGAVGQYALQESRDRAARGDDVVLVGLSSSAGSSDVQDVGRGHLTLIRIRCRPVDKGNLRRRAWWTLKTDLRLVWAARRHLRTAEEVLFTGSPPFLEHLLTPLSLLLGTRLTFRLSDFHPECLMAHLGRIPWWLRLFHALTLRWRRTVTRIEVLGEDQRRLLAAQGVADGRIVLRRSRSPVEVASHTPPLPIPTELAGRAVVLYSGAVTHAHEYETFVEGYRLHHHQGSARAALWLNATGVRADAFERAVREAGLPLHRTSAVPIDQLASLLITPDAHLITLRDAYVGLCVPSKVYGCIESRRDVLYVGSRQSEVHLLCDRHLDPRGYFRVDIGDGRGVARALEAVADRAAAGALAGPRASAARSAPKAASLGRADELLPLRATISSPARRA